MLLAWIGLLAIVMRVSGAAPAALVLFPPSDLLARLPAGISVLSVGAIGVTVRGEGNLAAALYAAGAPLVLPAGMRGCLGEAALPLGL